ncbi:voltage-dependent anion channel-domain-containing protein [Thelonectria olida]|uniref:Voltage-dependent anion channel-domain-containing protein n=1 Tax=Thelonectria olida TaxID=1576542 RepID=A0A9P8W766_9HYPO|nr:voltage-dependent anion channel-domain-containing protein [Thelonectria olida]
MPLSNFGSLFLHHIVFLTHLIYFHIAFSHMEEAAIVVLYFVYKLLARRPDDLDSPPPEWPPPVIECLNHVIAAAEKAPRSHNRKVGIRDRIACYQWTYFTMTMSTGGIANIMHGLKWHTSWIRGIGLFFFLLNIILFIANCVLLYMRFRLRPGTFIRSFTDQVESLFIPSFIVCKLTRALSSITVILINICQYGIPSCGPWLLHTMEVVFWVHGAISVCASAGLYLILWSTLIFPVHTMTPTWVFPAYPLLLNAPFAGNVISAAQKSGYSFSLNPTAMALGAGTLQGTGCLIAFMISAAFIYRLMTQKLPRDAQRPGIFMSIGPYGFTAAGIAQLGNQVDIIIPSTFIGTPNIAPIIKVVCILVSLWLWGLAMWFFIVCVGALWKYLRAGSSIPFQVTWWSFVFPNTALITATGVMGDVFESEGLHIFACVMTIAITIVWIIIFSKMLWALKTRKLLWPKNDI